jgi:hypothetical protein
LYVSDVKVHCDAIFTRNSLQAFDAAGTDDNLITVAAEGDGCRRSDARRSSCHHGYWSGLPRSGRSQSITPD